MLGAGRRGSARHSLVVACLVLVTACTTSPTSPPTSSDGLPPSSASTDSSARPGPSGGPARQDPLPADIVKAIDGIVDAPSLEAAIAATRLVLERSGVVITDDPATAARSVAGIYIDPNQLATMASEARSRATLTHATFSEFAETFGALALLPPNDALLDLLNAPAASPDPATASFALDLDGQPLFLAELLSGWVNRALAVAPSDDPLMTALTAPALYLAELASRQQEPIDLRQPFMPSRLGLGALDITLLIAGLRTSLVLGGGAAAAAGPYARLAQVDPTACGELSRRLNAAVPVLPDVGTFTAGELIKAYAEATVRDAFKRGASVSKAVAPAFEALGVLFRVQALWLLYQHTEVTLELKPETIHKSIAVNAPVAAYLVAGISDEEWAKAVADRNSSPLSANLKACARLLGVPLPSDLVDIGEATSTWRAAWSMPQGGGHAQFEGCQFIDTCQTNVSASGRLERKLTKRNDHQGEDTVIIEVKPEKETDHPGADWTAPVRVCAQLHTDKPPDTATLLNALTSGQTAGFGVGGIASLASSVANILLGWWEFVFTIDTCASTDVTFHVPQPGNWKGTIVFNSEFFESQTSRSGPQVYTESHSASITDTFYVGGDDEGSDGSGLGFSLAARQYTRGGEVFRGVDNLTTSNASGCAYTTDTVDTANGGWSFDGDTTATIGLTWDGKYTIGIDGVGPPDEVTLPGTWTKTITDNGSNYECVGFGTFTRDSPRAPIGVTATNGLDISGELDIAEPGSVLKGSDSFRDPNDPRYLFTVSWELTRDTPIVLPEYQPG